MPINQNNDIPIPEGLQPYTIIEERYVQSPTYPDQESGELIQTSTRYVEILVDDLGYDFLPTEGIAFGSLAYLLDYKELYYFNGNSWSQVGGQGGGGGGGLPDDGGNNSPIL